MKIILPALFLAMSAPATLADDTTGGFTGPDAVKLVSVSEAIAMPDESVAKVQGHIVKSLGDEKFEFRDDSGTVTVEIDKDDWRGVEATPDTRVELVVEVDREWRTPELEAESVRLVP